MSTGKRITRKFFLDPIQKIRFKIPEGVRDSLVYVWLALYCGSWFAFIQFREENVIIGGLSALGILVAFAWMFGYFALVMISEWAYDDSEAYEEARQKHETQEVDEQCEG